MDLVTGVTGYVGGLLARRLRDEGREVRGMARDPARAELPAGVEAVRGDALSGAGLEQALDGCDTAYYLIHSMERATVDGGFADRDRRAAETFARAAQSAGVERIVYFGGMAPTGEPSAHLGSRLEVERILLEAVPGSIGLRASIVIGARSDSFRLLVRLVERLPVIPLPPWRDCRTQPVDERDMLEFLARAPECPDAAGGSFDVAGRDLLTWGEIVERIADAMLIPRPPLRLGVSARPVASAVVSALTDLPQELVAALMSNLGVDIVPRNAEEAWRIFGIRPRPYDRAVEHALREWERHEPLAAR